MKKLILTGLLGLFLISCWTTVNPGERGVRVTLGKANEEVLDSGVFIWIPFVTKVKTLSVQTQKVDIPQSDAVSKDTQEMKVHVVVNYQIDPKNVVNIVKEFGDEDSAVATVLVPAVHEVLKQATAKKTLIEVLSKRHELKQEIDESLIERMSKYGIKVKDVSIVNLKFSDEFAKSVERKMVAEQEAKQAEYLAEKAKNEAVALVNTAKGQADAQRLLVTSLTPLILQKLAVEKWNGELPKVMGTTTSPFIDLNKLSSHSK